MTELRFTEEQLAEFYDDHDKFLRGIGCRQLPLRKHWYLLESISHDYYIRFDADIDNQNNDGADPETVSIFICSLDADGGMILIHNEATHEDVLAFVELLERFEKGAMNMTKQLKYFTTDGITWKPEGLTTYDIGRSRDGTYHLSPFFPVSFATFEEAQITAQNLFNTWYESDNEMTTDKSGVYELKAALTVLIEFMRSPLFNDGEGGQSGPAWNAEYDLCQILKRLNEK